MQNLTSTESKITDYFSHSGDLLKSESEVISAIMTELAASRQFVSNKAIILKLLEKLETETDIVQLDIYRHALEVVVQRTPDDIDA